MKLLGFALQIAIVALIAFQSWQIRELRGEVQRLSQNSKTSEASSLPSGLDSMASARLQAALRALARGNIEQARQSVKSAVAALEESATREKSSAMKARIKATQDYLEKQLHSIYQPAKGNRK